jgi:hypothetical protein
MFEVIWRVAVGAIVEQGGESANWIVSPLSEFAVLIASGSDPAPEDAQFVTVSVVAASAASGNAHMPTPTKAVQRRNVPATRRPDPESAVRAGLTPSREVWRASNGISSDALLQRIALPARPARNCDAQVLVHGEA